MLENYKFKFRSRGKFIFVPNERCVRKGERIMTFVAKRAKLPDYFYHYQPGGHVAALHSHVPHTLFFKIDIQNFFYSIARMRVARALRDYGLQGAHTFARWSCVSNPLSGPKFVLPIGFVQSPLLASLVLMRSPVADAIESAKNSGATISVYLDDIVGSHNDHGTLTAIYDDIRQACVTSNLIPNPNKLVSPTAAIVVFNCNLAHGRALVTEDRLAEFLAVPRTDASRQAFDQYRNRVAAANG
jgi:Reverse transcriptase (RNA-dependent DNA polymerase)